MVTAGNCYLCVSCSVSITI